MRLWEIRFPLKDNPEEFSPEPVGLKQSKVTPNRKAHMWHATSEERDRTSLYNIQYLALGSSLGHGFI